MNTNKRISGARNSPVSESDIRINYNDTNKIIAAANEIGASGGQGQFSSIDGGTTWSQTNLPVDTAAGDSFQSDPTVDWTSDGIARATAIGIDSTGTTLRLPPFFFLQYFWTD